MTRTVPSAWFGGTLVALALALTACSSGGGDGDDEGLPTEPFTLGVEIGGCFDRPTSPDVTAVPTVDCTEPHDFELYASADLEGDGYPGDDEVTTQALAACNEAFEPYVGVPPDQSGLVVVPVAPTAEQWEDGVRTVDCTVTIRAPDRLEGSVEGSEQPAG